MLVTVALLVGMILSPVIRITSPGLFSHRVLQQLTSEQVFPDAGTVTEFGVARDYGSTGFLAHSNSDSLFFFMKEGDYIVVFYADGSSERYRVVDVRRLQALTPRSTSSNFIDLDTGASLTMLELFSQTYDMDGYLILQTCIVVDGDWAWGRLFIIAKPAPPLPTQPR